MIAREALKLKAWVLACSPASQAQTLAH